MNRVPVKTKSSRTFVGVSAMVFAIISPLLAQETVAPAGRSSLTQMPEVIVTGRQPAENRPGWLAEEQHVGAYGRPEWTTARRFPGTRVYLESAHLYGDATAPALFSGRGYKHARTFCRMVRSSVGSELSPSLPAGLTFRPFDPDLHGPAVHAAFEEAFVSEWGHQPQAYTEWFEKKIVAHTRFDPELVVVVWDGDEVAGLSFNYDKRMGDWGWIANLAVRPAWRRRGLGLALLQESFRRFAEHGEATVALGVDSENPTGATRLYERAGMTVLWRADVWQKELRAGD